MTNRAIPGRVQAVVRFLFRLVWGRRLPKCRVISATSWRRGTVEFPGGQRMRGTMCFHKSNAELGMGWKETKT